MSTRSKTLLLSLLLCFTALGMGYLFLQHTPSWGFAQALSRHHELFDSWRYTLYSTFFFAWPYFIEYMAKRRHWPHSITTILIHQRIKIAVFFILIEIFLIHNALGHFIGWVFH